MRNSILIALAFFFFVTKGQQEQQYSQYMLNQFALNPAVAGTEDFVDIVIGARKQWAGFESAPTTTFITAHMPLGKKRTQFHHVGENKTWHGVGVQAFSDITGPISRNSLLLAYAYNLPITSTIRLSSGAYLGFKQWKTNTEKWRNIDDESDYLFANNLNSGLLPDLHLGVCLYSPNFYVNLSTFSLLQNDLKISVNNDAENAKQYAHYFLNGGLRLWLNETTQISPSIMLKYTNGTPLSVDLNGKITHNNKFWYGFSYRVRDAFNVFVGAEFNNQLYASYAFEWSHTAIGKHIVGSHEIILGLRLKAPKAIDCPSKYW